MEAADDAVPGVAPLGGPIVRCEDATAGAAGRTKEGGLGQGKKVEVAERPDFRGGVGTEAFRQQPRSTGIA